MKVIIIGGKGFVGQAIVRYCRDTGISHTVIDRKNYRRFMNASCDVLINANGNSKKFLAESDPGLDFELSVRSVMNTIRDFRFKTYVYLSSVAVYPDAGRPGRSRESFQPEVSRQSHYGFHKYLAEQMVRHYCRSWVILRLGGLIGPGMTKGPVFDILNGKSLWVDPRSRFQFLETRFVAEAVFRLLKKGKTNQIYNLTGRGTVKILDALAWAGRSLIKKDSGSKTETWHVDLKKIFLIMSVPETKAVTRDFIVRAQSPGSKG